MSQYLVLCSCQHLMHSGRGLQTQTQWTRGSSQWLPLVDVENELSKHWIFKRQYGEMTKS